VSGSAPLAATVGAHGPDGGWVVLDDGTRWTYAPEAVAPEVRVLHPGQRVHLRAEGTVVRALTLPGMPLPD
jgi:hypothetical protein